MTDISLELTSMEFFEYVILQRGRSLQCFMKHAQKLYFFAFLYMLTAFTEVFCCSAGQPGS